MDLSIGGTAVTQFKMPVQEKPTKREFKSYENESKYNRESKSGESKREHKSRKSDIVSLPKPTSVQRPKIWSPEAENAFRIQSMGWRDVYEYRSVHGEDPEVWEDTGYFSRILSKKTGYITYWTRAPELESKYLHRVKVYNYD
jgi:hypothetical protein